MRSPTLLFPLLISGCATTGLVAPTTPAAVAQDATILCQDGATGVVLARVIDPALVQSVQSHNTVDIAIAEKVCAVYGNTKPAAVPLGATTVPVTLTPHEPVAPDSSAP